ncbi:MAG: hypothetical protein ABI318_13170 [Chthoniobacteraceae bacterium]
MKKDTQPRDSRDARDTRKRAAALTEALRKRGSTEENKDPDRDLWDFSKCPDNLLYYCHRYEFLRHLQGYIQTGLERRAVLGNPSFEQCVQWCYSPVAALLQKMPPEGSDAHFHPFISGGLHPCWFEEFPAKPFLSIDPKNWR